MDPSRCRVIQTLPPKHLAVCARGRRCCCTVQKPRLIEFIAKQYLADSIAVRLTKVIDAPTPIRPDTKLFWAGSPIATNWKRQPRPACYENGRHRRFDFPHDPSAPDLQEEHVCFFLNEKLSKGKTIWRHRGQRTQRRAEAEKETARFIANFKSQMTKLLIN